jgi:nucleotide-binding universal stress UspA family protein
MDTFRSVLCAIDLGWEAAPQAGDANTRSPLLGPLAEATLRTAAREASFHGADLMVLHALPMDPGAPMSPAAVEAWLLKRQELASVVIDAVLVAVERVAGRAPENVPVLVEDGPADRAILDAAQRVGAELVVVGCSGAKGLRGALLGSVASAVVRDARCSVLVVRPLDGQRADAPSATPVAPV